MLVSKVFHNHEMLSFERILLTIYPSNTNRLENGKEQKSASTTSVIVKQLKHVQSTLQKQKILRAQFINMKFNCLKTS